MKSWIQLPMEELKKILERKFNIKISGIELVDNRLHIILPDLQIK